jgi:hypothetical protein
MWKHAPSQMMEKMEYVKNKIIDTHENGSPRYTQNIELLGKDER